MARLYGGVLGKSRKKIGDIITYVVAGEQFARSKAVTVANPRTAAQMVQRTRLANLVNFYRANMRWMEKYAFEGKRKGWSVQNAFVSANSGEVAVHLTKQQAAQHNAIVAPYIVSSGSLPSVIFNRHSDGSFVSNLNYDSTGPEPGTIGELSRGLLENNNGLREGMQLSIIANYQYQYGDVYSIVCRSYELILNVNDATSIAERVPVELITPDHGALCFSGYEDSEIIGFTYVLSETRKRKTFVSSQALTLTDSSLYETFRAQADAAAESYGVSEVTFLETGYQGNQSDNSDVILPVSILSVNGVSAGGQLQLTGGQQLTIVMSGAVPTDVTTGRIAFKFSGGSATYYLDVESISGATVVSTAYSASGTSYITQLTLTLASTDYVISFSSSSDEGLTD